MHFFKKSYLFYWNLGKFVRSYFGLQIVWNTINSYYLAALRIPAVVSSKVLQINCWHHDRSALCTLIISSIWCSKKANINIYPVYTLQKMIWNGIWIVIWVIVHCSVIGSSPNIWIEIIQIAIHIECYTEPNLSIHIAIWIILLHVYGV